VIVGYKSGAMHPFRPEESGNAEDQGVGVVSKLFTSVGQITDFCDKG
jgi:hypothetical protein